MRTFNLSLTIASALVAILLLTDNVLSHANATTTARLNQVQQLVNGTPNNRNALRAIATRVNQSAASDSDLKAVLQRLEISVAPEPTK